MEKWMTVYLLPLEVWMDIFCFPWITRAEFGQLVEKIGNFKFAEHAQFFLHEWGKRKLPVRLYFKKDGMVKYVINYLWSDIPNPTTPLPANIKSFDSIEIKHFDAKTLDFLDKIRPLLTTDLELSTRGNIPNSLENLRTILTNLAPFLDETETLCCNQCSLPMGVVFAEQQLAKLKMLKFYFFDEHVEQTINGEQSPQEHVNSIMHWLTQPEQGEDNNNTNDGPKLFYAALWPIGYGRHGLCEQFAEHLSEAVHEQFLAAKTPCTFAVILRALKNHLQLQFAEFHLANSIGEQLHGEWVETQYGQRFQITRHGANCNKEGLQQWIKQMTEKRRSQIEIDRSTVGSLDVAAQMDVTQDEEQAEQQQPGSSKDA